MKPGQQILSIYCLILARLALASGFEYSNTQAPPPENLPDYFGSSPEKAGCKTPETEAYLPDPAAGACKHAPFKSGEDFAGSLASYVKTNNIVSGEDLLPCLPQELRKNYVLAKDSRSPHASCSAPPTAITKTARKPYSEQNPRIVLFSADGKQIVALPGKMDRPECKNIEVVQYNADLGKYLPDRVKLPTGERHSGDCASCHGSKNNFVPKWNSYPVWPGFYGTKDDMMGTTDTQGLRLDNDSDVAAWKKFAAPEGNFNQGAYRFLMRPNAAEPKNQLYSPFQAPGEHSGNSAFRPNFRFTAALIRSNALRIAAQLSKGPAHETQKIRATAMLLGCPLTAKETQQLEQQRKNLELPIRTEGRIVYRDYLDAERKEGFLGIGNPSCDKPDERLSVRGVSRFCPNTTEVTGATRIETAARWSGLSDQQTNELALEIPDITNDPDHRTMELASRNGDLGTVLTARAMLLELKKRHPELEAFTQRNLKNPTCENAHDPTKRLRCLAVEACDTPPPDLALGPDKTTICEKLNQIAARGNAVVSSESTSSGLDAGRASQNK